jgi:hypothetical protein
MSLIVTAMVKSAVSAVAATAMVAHFGHSIVVLTSTAAERAYLQEVRGKFDPGIAVYRVPQWYPATFAVRDILLSH